MTVAHCGSTRLVNGETIHCDRRFNHPSSQKHRAVLSDFTTILWEGDDSGAIVPRMS